MAQLTPSSVDPKLLLKPTSVAKQLGVHPSMVTHWTDGGQLPFVLIDGMKFIPVEAVVTLETLRSRKAEEREARKQEAAEAVPA